MNFDMACEIVEMEDDIATMTVRVKDDVASAPKENKDKRRGVAGMVYAFKVAGAAAKEGRDLKGVAAAAKGAISVLWVWRCPCIVPEVGKPFSV